MHFNHKTLPLSPQTHSFHYVFRLLETNLPLCLCLYLSLSSVSLPDPPGDERFPEAAGRLLRRPETIPEECVCSERLFPVSWVHVCLKLDLLVRIFLKSLCIIFNSNMQVSMMVLWCHTEVFQSAEEIICSIVNKARHILFTEHNFNKFNPKCFTIQINQNSKERKKIFHICQNVC